MRMVSWSEPPGSQKSPGHWPLARETLPLGGGPIIYAAKSDNQHAFHFLKLSGTSRTPVLCRSYAQIIDQSVVMVNRKFHKLINISVTISVTLHASEAFYPGMLHVGRICSLLSPIKSVSIGVHSWLIVFSTPLRMTSSHCLNFVSSSVTKR